MHHAKDPDPKFSFVKSLQNYFHFLMAPKIISFFGEIINISDLYKK